MPMKNQVAVFAHYDDTPLVAKHVLYHLQALRQFGFRICFVSHSAIAPPSQAQLETVCERIIVQENAGFDFYMWRRGLLEYDVANLEELLLVNSSIIGPLRPLADLWRNPEIAECDFWGLTDNAELGMHLQSYFLVFRRAVLQSARFLDFWKCVLPYRDKEQVIRSYEVGLTRWLEEAGFNWKAVFTQDRMFSLYWSQRGVLKKARDRYYNRSVAGRNSTLFFPDCLLQSGMPYLKLALLRDASPRLGRAKIWGLLKASNLPVDIWQELELKYGAPGATERKK